MPNLTEYLRGFEIHKGLQISGYILDNIRGIHNPIIKYRQYEYIIELTFLPQSYNANYNELLTNLRELTNGVRIIYSSYGNPYRCDFGSPVIENIYSNGNVIISTIGHSYRI